MPMITVQYATSQQRAGLKKDVAAAVSNLSATLLHKDPTVTAVLVRAEPADDWFVGGASLDQGLRAEAEEVARPAARGKLHSCA